MRNTIKKILREEKPNHYFPQDSSIVKLIKKILGNTFRDWYTDWFDNIRYDFEVNFHVIKANVWKVEEEHKSPQKFKTYYPKEDSIWEGTIYIKIDEFKIINPHNETLIIDDFDDIHESAYLNFEDYLVNTVNRWIPGLSIDVDIDF